MDAQDNSSSVTRGLGRLMFTARWLMAPIYVGLLVGLALLVVKFVQKLLGLVPGLLAQSSSDTVLAVLSLVDLSLVANLVLIVVLAGWQGFVDPLLGTRLDDKPAWLALDFSAVKLKLIGAIATIAALEMLEGFIHVETVPVTTIAAQLAILVAWGVLGLLMAAMDRVSHGTGKE